MRSANSRVIGRRCAAAVAALALLSGCGGGTEREPEPGDITGWAGDGTQGHDGDGNHRTESWLNQPMEIVFASDGSGYIVDWNNHAIRRVSPDGILETVLGAELPGDWPCQTPEDPANCEVPLDQPADASRVRLNHPTDLVFDGKVAFIAAWHNHKVERFDLDQSVVEVIAGREKPGFAGDDGPAADALMNFPDSIVLDASGALVVSDERNNRVRRIVGENPRMISTVVGSRTESGFAGADVPATESEVAFSPYNEAGGADNPPPGAGLALDADGNLYLADTFNHCVRRVAPGADGLLGAGDPLEEIITTVAGECGVEGFAGDGGPAAEARLRHPHDIEIGPDGRIYVADTDNHAIRRIDPATGVIDTVAGTGTAGDAGDGGPAVQAQLRRPYGLAFDPAGDLFVVDTGNNRIRKIVQ